MSAQWQLESVQWMSLEQMLRDTADRGEAARSFTGIERRVVMLLRDAADELAKNKERAS